LRTARAIATPIAPMRLAILDNVLSPSLIAVVVGEHSGSGHLMSFHIDHRASFTKHRASGHIPWRQAS
jgi:hypothetical protein